MNIWSDTIMHQRNEKSNGPKRKTTSSINTHQRYRQHRRQETLRRTFSHGLPSLATNTVQMVVATLHLASNDSDNHNDQHSKMNFDHRNLLLSDDNNDQITTNDDDDDDDEAIVHLGREVQAHLPDIVLNNLDELIDQNGQIRIPNEHRYNNGTLLFLDVSGFTSLTEQYSNDAHLGIDQLTRTLNSYFEKLVVEILIHDGDIYKFAGDAILALWINEQTGPQRALECALNLQKKCGDYQTDVGVVLHLKVALAYGPVRALFVGTDEFKHYLLTGDCVTQVNYCEQLCEAGDIIISPQIYQRLNLNSFQCEFVVVRNDDQNEHILVKPTSISIIDKAEESLSLTNSNEPLEMNNGDWLDADVSTDELNEKKDSLMKSFLLHCVYQRIERQQSLHYLSELRRVTISFINLDISNEKTIDENLHLELQKIFVHIYEQTKMMGGVLTKALLFDKGWSFLCVFGLPGYKQGDDTANALKSAQMIHSTIAQQSPYVRKCSIGVTTGLTYCGVVGHQMRCEYTVIGRKVNLAARLMCNYPNVISCDQETFYNSRLNKINFQILPDKTLKGMNNVGLIWEYGENSNRCEFVETKETKRNFRQSFHEIQREDYPILGRRLELMIVTTQLMLLDEPIDSPNRRRDLAAIIFEGEDKIGRTRLLQFIGTCLENAIHLNNPSFISHYENTYIPHETTINRLSFPLSPTESSISGLSSYANDLTSIRRTSIQVISYRCQFEQRFNEFGLLRALLRQLFQFQNNDKTEFEREQFLLRLFDINKANDLHLRRNLYLLNDFLDVRFRRSCLDTETNLVETHENHLNELLVHILNKFIDSSNQMAECYATTNEICGVVSSQYRTSCESTTNNHSTSIFTVSKIIFLIDDIHFADEASLKYLLTLGSHRRSLLILSMKPPTNNNNDRPNSNTLQSIRTDSRVYRRRLNGLDARFLSTLACQILSVHRLPSKLVNVLTENCNGIPGFCEQILFDLLSKEKIYIVNENCQTNSVDQSLIEGDAEKLLSNDSSRHGLVKSFFLRRKIFVTAEQRKSEPAFSRQCFLKNPLDNDFNAEFEQNFQNYIMCRIDRLSEGESLLVKIGAVIGNTFSRMFLWHLVDPPSKKLININSCILDMMGRMVVECAYGKILPNKTRSIKCYCRSNPAGFPSSCRLLAFTHSTIREGIYNSLTDSLKRSLIRNAIDYLERHATVVCLTCGANRHESPVLVHNDDGLAKIVQNRQQHAFVDIVRMAALKEIDDVIRDLAHAADSLGKPSTTQLTESPSIRSENFSPATDPNGSVPMNFAPIDSEDRVEVKVHRDNSRRNSTDPNLTLISVFSPDVTKPIQVNVQRSSSAVNSRTTQLFSLFKLPKRTTSNREILQTVSGSLKNVDSSKDNNVVQAMKNPKRNRLWAFFRFIFCQFVPVTSSIVQIENEDSSPRISQRASAHSIESPPVRTLKPDSYWRKVRKAVLPSREKTFRSMPDENELIRQSIFSAESMSNFAANLKLLTKHIDQTRTFETLYNQSFVFHQFQSFHQWNKLLQYVYDTRASNDDLSPADLNQFVSNFNAYNDLRTCECADYVITIYMKLIEYHQNLYEIYEKSSDHLRIKQFDRLMFYRMEICQLLIRCNCLQRLLVEIDNGQKILKKFREENEILIDSFAHYQCLFLDCQWNFYQAIFLQRTRAINEAKQICEENFPILKRFYDEKIWEKLPLNVGGDSSAKERRQQFEQSKESPTKELSAEFSLIAQSSNSLNSDQLSIFAEKYRLEYLLCQYNFLHYELSRQHISNESFEYLLQFDYFQFPLTFSLRCTVVLVEHFYCRMNYRQCLNLIDKITNFWWPFVPPREKLELAKLKCLSLIIDLKRGEFESAILSGYFAKRILTGYHENVFLIESCIYLSLALISEMRLANIEAILQHLNYLSEQTMNCYAKLWYYILMIDVALELGYEFLPLNVDLLENIVKYRKRLLSGPNQRSLALFYADCVLAQIFARLGLIETSKIHFHYVFHQLKFDSINLSNIDFRFKRGLLKLAEVQLVHWYHLKDDQDENFLTKDSFLLNYFHQETNEEFLSWNKTRFGIYCAYYDRLINVYRREKCLEIDNDYHWREILDEIEQNAIELDRLWIDQLRQSWSLPVSEQVLHVRRQPSLSLRTPTNGIVRKSSSRRCIRPSISPLKHRFSKTEKLLDENSIYSHQTFVNWRSALHPHHSTTFFQLYLLPVRI